MEFQPWACIYSPVPLLPSPLPPTHTHAWKAHTHTHTQNRNHPVVQNGVSLYFRGFPILQATLQSLLEKGMSNAQEVILTGCSAGGLATYIHADYVASILPPTAKYRAMADAGCVKSLC